MGIKYTKQPLFYEELIMATYQEGEKERRRTNEEN